MNQPEKRRAALLNWLNRHTQYSCQQLQTVSGDASFRRYYRFFTSNGSVVAVDAPPEQENSKQFALVAQAYHEASVRVPRVLEKDFEQGFYCLEDFGDRQFAEALNPESYLSLYRSALTQLPLIQSCTGTSEGALPEYDKALFDRDFHLFTHWLLGEHLSLTLTEHHKAMLEQVYKQLHQTFYAQPVVGVHRDFHSRNLMLLEEGAVGVIDFQDAATGPVTYDLVSLLRDCYLTWPKQDMLQLAREYRDTHLPDVPWPQFKRWFDLTGMQRHLKASGIFARLWHRDKKSTYLHDIPRTLAYVVDVGREYPELAEFAEFVEQQVLPLVEKKQP